MGQGGDVTFTVTAISEDETITYQWSVNGMEIAGATSDTLSLTNVMETDEGTYSVEVSNTQLSTTSENSSLSVGKYGSVYYKYVVISMLLLLSAVTPPVIDVQPSDQCVPLMVSAVFQVEASGEGVLSYQWVGPNDVSLSDIPGKISGSDDKTLVILNVAATDVGNYQIQVTNNFGTSVRSSVASLSICKLVCHTVE